MSENNPKKGRDAAVALHYDDKEEGAPRVTAKGFGLMAEQIRELAEQSGIPIRKDSDLVELLSQIDVDREIPPQLYAAVAEVLAMVYKANNAVGAGE
ncbi:MAG: EscU/YscU/HrcU family type III secretion system export apparatus switch protein [Chitinispirillia bacterium]|nr:EscU/YscU/HrcU family type III secretion system export apparatus switch protein [Chitinispirillia bacterium]MCL2241202.1 EscU/YscU/HrcU family type III secretion system export apparatus switch protein [Chitinispirillia bacterium]